MISKERSPAGDGGASLKMFFENSIIPNVGMLASYDPVALDQVCADLCNKIASVEESVRGENPYKLGNEMGHNHFFMPPGYGVEVLYRPYGEERAGNASV